MRKHFRLGHNFKTHKKKSLSGKKARNLFLLIKIR